MDGGSDGGSGGPEDAGRTGTHLDAGVEPSLRAGDVSFDADDAALLRAVAEHGSLNRAADALGRSYSRAHKRLSALEAAFGPLVERRRGGPDGGGSELTAAGEDLLARFERLRAAVDGTAAAAETVFPGEVRAWEGELAVVETPAGRLRALAPDGATDVQVSVRADAVTLQAPAASPAAGATSAHNRLEGVVETVDRGESVARVAVDVGTGEGLVALVTVASVDRLELAPGTAVVASIKATATRATPR